jgi:hypothetical protein
MRAQAQIKTIRFGLPAGQGVCLRPAVFVDGIQGLEILVGGAICTQHHSGKTLAIGTGITQSREGHNQGKDTCRKRIQARGGYKHWTQHEAGNCHHITRCHTTLSGTVLFHKNVG